MTDVQEIDQRVVTALQAAHADPRWAGPDWTDPVARVRRAARVSRVRHVAAGTAVAVTLGAAGGLAAATWWPTGATATISPAGQDAGSTGLDWLLTPAQWQAYTAVHPSPSPSRDLVGSPAPHDDELQRLEGDVTAALPAGARVVRSDAADGGDRGHAVVWLRLADDTPVAVERYRLDYPVLVGDDRFPTAGTSGDGTREAFSGPEELATRSALAVMTGNGFGYGFDAATQWNGPIVWVATADGWFTFWTAPVPVRQLQGWAVAADRSFTAATG